MRWFAVACRSLVPIAFLFASESLARAQTAPAGSDKVAAEFLFEDARKLVTQGKYADACPKFADSQRLDPSPSTLLNLANCWEKLGRTATAWATYREAESAANAAKRLDYMATAQRHADALAPTLARLTIRVDQPIAGMQLRRDGVLVGPAEWGVAIPVDKGSHTLEASAPGYKDWTARVDVAQDGAQLAASVPVLDAVSVETAPASVPILPMSAVPEPAPSPSPDLPPERASPQRTVGLVIGGLGIVGLGVSGVLAVVAVSKKNDSMNHCESSDRNVCPLAAFDERNDALSLGDAASWVVGASAVALATGVVVWITAPRSGPSSARAAGIAVVPGPGGAVVRGTW